MWIHSGMEPARPRRPDPATTVALALPGLLIAEALARVLRDHGCRSSGATTPTPALLATACAARRPTVAVVDAELARARRRSAALAALAAAGRATRLVVLAAAFDARSPAPMRRGGRARA